MQTIFTLVERTLAHLGLDYAQEDSDVQKGHYHWRLDEEGRAFISADVYRGWILIDAGGFPLPLTGLGRDAALAFSLAANRLLLYGGLELEWAESEALHLRARLVEGESLQMRQLADTLTGVLGVAAQCFGAEGLLPTLTSGQIETAEALAALPLARWRYDPTRQQPLVEGDGMTTYGVDRRRLAEIVTVPALQIESPWEQEVALFALLASYDLDGGFFGGQPGDGDDPLVFRTVAWHRPELAERLIEENRADLARCLPYLRKVASGELDAYQANRALADELKDERSR